MTTTQFVATALLALSCLSVSHAGERPSTLQTRGSFQTTVTTFGPVQLQRDNAVRICESDISPHLDRSHPTRESWTSAAVEVYRSTDLEIPISRSPRDLIYSTGRGQCVDLNVSDFASLVSPDESLLILVTSISPTGSKAVPTTTGQLSSGDPDDSAVGLVLPAVNHAPTATDWAPRKRKRCCPGWPTCGFGICEN